MKLKKAMENFYFREVEIRQIPAIIPGTADLIPFRKSVKLQSALALNIIFNTAAAAIFCFILLTRDTYKNPFVDVLGVVNDHYALETKLCRGLEMLPGYLNQK